MACLVAGLFAASAGGAHAAAGNDDFAAAQNLAIGSSATGDSTGATQQAGEPAPSCATTGATVWYEVDSSVDQRIKLSTFGSKFDTVLAVFAGDGLDSLTEVACEDDDPATGSQQSQLTFPALTGMRYWVQVGGYQGAAGPLTLAASVDPRPANDNMADATLVIPPLDSDVNLDLATTESGEPSTCAGWLRPAGTVWYRFSSPEHVALNVHVSGDAALSVFNRDASGFQGVGCISSAQSIPVEPGVDYWLQLAGSGWSGLSLDVQTPPANDEVATARPIAVSQLARQMTYSATAQADEGNCQTYWRAQSTVWYVLDATSTQSLVATTSGSDYDTVVGVWQANASGRPEGDALACSDNTSSAHQQSAAPFDAVAGRRYLIQVDGSPWSPAGNLELRVLPATSVMADRDTGVIVAHDDQNTEVGAGGETLGTGGGADVTKNGDTGYSYVDECVGAFITSDCEGAISWPH